MSRRHPAAVPDDGAFLTGPALFEAVLHVIGGRDRRCAVAFWGLGVEGILNVADEGCGPVRIVCDLSMGGSNPDALRALGAPDEPSIRHRDGLHAKIYLSDRGAVVGSANASENGLGFGPGGPGLVEAATFHAPGSPTWEGAASWFERLDAEATQVDEAALVRARRLLRPIANTGRSRPVRPGSLLDMVAARPEAFEGVGFVLASASSSAEERRAARRLARRAGIDRETIESTEDHDMFIGWGTATVLRWPVSFFELWMPGDRLHIYARTVKAVDTAAGNVLSRKDLRAVRRLVASPLPDLRAAERLDAEVAGRLLTDEGLMFRTAAEFAAAIDAATPR